VLLPLPFLLQLYIFFLIDIIFSFNINKYIIKIMNLI
jgi:hypothetical protein